MKKNAFTLVELLVVIAIIGILVTTAAVYYNKARIASRDAKRKTDIENASASLELYYSQNKKYPTTEDIAAGGFECWDQLMQILIEDEELSGALVDPKNNETYNYGCYASDDGRWFILYSVLENTDEKTTIDSREVDSIEGGSGVMSSDGENRLYRIVVR